MRISDLSDLVRRRTYILLPADGFRAIYVNVSLSPMQVVFVLDRDVPAPELAKLRLKYKRVFGDKESDISVMVYNSSDYCGLVADFALLYSEGLGFIL